MNEALRLGASHLTGSMFPENFEYYLEPLAPEYDPGKAKQLLAEAGYPRGFDAGDYYCDAGVADKLVPQSSTTCKRSEYAPGYVR